MDRFLIKRLPNAADLPLPQYMTESAAGMDLYAAIDEPVKMEPMGRVVVPCGFQMALPHGYEAQIRPRSGLARQHGVTMLNAPGTIDADYRGEVGVLLINLGDAPYTINRGDRIAQMIVAKAIQVAFEEADELPDSARGAGGFGSTGKS